MATVSSALQGKENQTSMPAGGKRGRRIRVEKQQSGEFKKRGGEMLGPGEVGPAYKVADS